MKPTGIVRKVDNLGRVVIPMELRRSLSLDQEGPVEIFVNGDYILLRKYEPGCTLCGELRATVVLNQARVCHSYIRELTKHL